MRIDWQLFLQILIAILRILQELPPDTDHTTVCRLLGDACEANNTAPEGGPDSHG